MNREGYQDRTSEIAISHVYKEQQLKNRKGSDRDVRDSSKRHTTKIEKSDKT